MIDNLFTARMLLNETRNEEVRIILWLVEEICIFTRRAGFLEKKSKSQHERAGQRAAERGEKNKKSLRVVEADQGWQQSKPGALQKPELAITKFAVKH